MQRRRRRDPFEGLRLSGDSPSHDMGALDRRDTNGPRYWKESRFASAVDQIQASRWQAAAIERMNDVMQEVDG